MITRFLFALLLLAAAPVSAQTADSLALDGPWRFRQGDDAAWAQPALDDGAWRTLSVPGAWDEQIGDYDGFAWYRREVVLPEGMQGAPVG
ncbi:MAG TPA: hypothetical protein VFT45_20360, partial [Longimicrobium sp.]|nr:hypothetical protein [Longimicrobium sp.]